MYIPNFHQKKDKKRSKCRKLSRKISKVCYPRYKTTRQEHLDVLNGADSYMGIEQKHEYDKGQFWMEIREIYKLAIL